MKNQTLAKLVDECLLRVVTYTYSSYEINTSYSTPSKPGGPRVESPSPAPAHRHKLKTRKFLFTGFSTP